MGAEERPRTSSGRRRAYLLGVAASALLAAGSLMIFGGGYSDVETSSARSLAAAESDRMLRELHAMQEESSSGRTLRELQESDRMLRASCEGYDLPMVSYPPPDSVMSTFVSAYPGSGANMTQSLVESLTGLVSGDEFNLAGHGVGNAVTIKTHWPHESCGNAEVEGLAGKDWLGQSSVPRVVLVLRHPKDAIPALHNFRYAQQRGRSATSTDTNGSAAPPPRAPIEEWIRWRDRNFEGQLKWWAHHVDYWMDRYPKAGEDRLVLAYEALTDERGGPASARGLAAFLDRSEGVAVGVDDGKIPCVWRRIVRPVLESKDDFVEEVEDWAEEEGEDKAKRSLTPREIIEHTPGFTGGSDYVRSYTERQLDLMVKTIRTLHRKYKGDAQLVPWLQSYKRSTLAMRRRLKLHIVMPVHRQPAQQQRRRPDVAVEENAPPPPQHQQQLLVVAKGRGDDVAAAQSTSSSRGVEAPQPETGKGGAAVGAAEEAAMSLLEVIERAERALRLANEALAAKAGAG